MLSSDRRPLGSVEHDSMWLKCMALVLSLAAVLACGMPSSTAWHRSCSTSFLKPEQLSEEIQPEQDAPVRHGSPGAGNTVCQGVGALPADRLVAKDSVSLQWFSCSHGQDLYRPPTPSPDCTSLQLAEPCA